MLLLAALLGCKGSTSPPPPDDTASAISCGSADWWGTGQPLLLDFCTGCHSSHITGSHRYGAPESVNLETLEGALQHIDRIRVRVLEEGDMPPGGGMSAEQLTRLAAWLDCDNQTDNPLPISTSTLPEAISTEFTISISNEDGWLVVRRTDFSGAPWSEEYYLTQGSNAWFGGYTVFDPVLFGVERAVLFEPLIQMTSSQEAEDWSVTVSAEVEEDGVVTTEEQTWSVSYGGTPSAIDGRSVDHSPTQVVMTSDTGEVHVWHLSDTRILAGRWIGSEDYLLQALRSDHYSPDFPEPDEGFPFQSGDSWMETALLI